MYLFAFFNAFCIRNKMFIISLIQYQDFLSSVWKSIAGQKISIKTKKIKKIRYFNFITFVFICNFLMSPTLGTTYLSYISYSINIFLGSVWKTTYIKPKDSQNPISRVIKEEINIGRGLEMIKTVFEPLAQNTYS